MSDPVPPAPAPAPLEACDVVMKGGVTSGVVYPLAVVELAQRYRFHCIGGTSAGAIAAGLTAAAERGREAGGFERLAGTARTMGGQLRQLFRPTPDLAPLFHFLLALVRGRGAGGKLVAAVRALAFGYWPWTLIGLVPAIGLAGLAVAWRSTGFAVAALLAAVMGLFAAWLYRLQRALRRELPANGFGLCTGLGSASPDRPGLTDWLADLLDDLADLSASPGAPGDHPLTFGDLEACPGGAIQLKVMTSCLSLGRPYALPFETDLFVFRPEELRRLFPERVVRFMVEHSAEDEEPGFRKLPPAGDFPVIVALRMSLAFPLLFAAVPLWARDYGRRGAEEQRRLRRMWFSDGGLCSNFPIHFFDRLWPVRPTFGITLEPAGESARERRVWLPASARQGILLRSRPLDDLGSFFSALLDTMQEWQDNLQSTLPGYRERIVHVGLTHDEGGLNLDMDPEIIERLVELGGEAGRKLRDGFDWEAHRWTRCLSTIEQLQAELALLHGISGPEEGTVETVSELVARRDLRRSPYGQTETWRRAALKLLDAWEKTASDAAATEVAESDHLPRPTPRLRMTPRL